MNLTCTHARTHAHDYIASKLYEEMLEEALGLEYGEWKSLAHAASRGDTKGSLDKIALQCKKHKSDLSPWGQLLDVYGIFAVGMGALDTTLMYAFYSE